VLAKWLWNVKEHPKKVAKNTSIAQPPTTKCFLVTHNFLDWYEILTTWTRLTCAICPQKIIGNGHCMKKEWVAKVHHNTKMSRFWTSNCFQAFRITWIDIKILPL